jgi:triacylglycerol esterase/lipase EstA (alpha/beta hydrolase family)
MYRDNLPAMQQVARRKMIMTTASMMKMMRAAWPNLASR